MVAVTLLYAKLLVSISRISSLSTGNLTLVLVFLFNQMSFHVNGSCLNRVLLAIPCFFGYAGDQNKILPSDKNVVREQILLYVSQLPQILR